jgi:hypothetical protein
MQMAGQLLRAFLTSNLPSVSELLAATEAFKLSNESTVAQIVAEQARRLTTPDFRDLAQSRDRNIERAEVLH